ncbi:MAG: YegS/Rv2252/BmrU family lipid kinase [Deltaproteobacteria bacterium]|nr:YegS/Rv2252/BmrU family lipid kinase [Deltaproteobacteria bacterium]
MNDAGRYVIVNGAAGGGRCAGRCEPALDALRSAGFELEVAHTERAGHATELARAAFAKGHRKFVSVGGDGTSFEVINGLLPEAEGQGVELGLLPLGTGNSFLRDFAILDPDAALSALQGWKAQPVDVVKVVHAEGSFHYMNLIGLGFTARAGDLTNRRFKRLGPAGYVAAVLVSVAGLEKPVDPIKIDDADYGDARPAVFLVFSNSKYTGGAMKMAPDADPTDGYLDVIRAGDIGRASLVKTFPKIFAGRHVEHPRVEQGRAKKVEFLEPRKQPVMVDGEIMHLALESLEVRPGALSVVTGERR